MYRQYTLSPRAIVRSTLHVSVVRLRSQLRIIVPPHITRPNVLRLAPAMTRADAGMSAAQRRELAKRRLAAARKILDANPRASLREIARGVAIATKHRCNTDRARESLLSA